MTTLGRLLLLTGPALFVVASLAPLAVAQPAREIPDREWYPEGYLDLKFAAERQLEQFRDDEPARGRGTRTVYRVTFPAEADADWQGDLLTAKRATLAMSIARMRAELAAIGYDREVYDAPLLAYERAALQGYQTEVEFLGGPEYLEPHAMPSAVKSNLLVPDWDLIERLAVDLEAGRQRLNPDKPRIDWDVGAVSAGEYSFTIRLSPPTGELWLVNAFAFHVCERKVADPWDHGACGWTQYQEGDSAVASGRYMYEARWPDGTVKRGARVLQGDPESDESDVIAFRRN